MSLMDRLRQPAAPAKPQRRAVNYATSPLLASKTPPWRSRFLVALVGLAFLGLLARAFYVQVFATEFYQKQGDLRSVHTLELPASRGRISDRSGQVLAASVAMPSIWAIPKDVEADPAKRAELAKDLQMSPSDLSRKLDGDSHFVWLRRLVDDETATRVKDLGLKGVYQEREYRRRYPEGEAAAHVVGFTNADDRGQEGIELAFDKQLQGKDGQRSIVRDRLGRAIDDVGDSTPAVNGQDIDLSIDSQIQFFAYQAIRDAVAENKAAAGSVVVLDAKTGEILALANVPSYDPGNRLNLSGSQLRNRALTDTAEPGSTMKPFTIGLALDTGRVTPDTVITTAPHSLTIAGFSPSDDEPHAQLTVSEVVQKSSNIGAGRIGLSMQPRELYDMYTAIGLGQRPQIDFPGAVSGRLRPYKSWRPIEQMTMSYGYGLSVSLLQLAHAYTVFAHDGEVIPLTMLKQPPGAAAQGVRVFSSKTAAQVREMLSMVTSAGGTAAKAQVDGWRVGGKTGTARKQEGRGYASHKYRAWFVGLAPIDHPRIVVGVMVDEPSGGIIFGGLVAAPVFTKLAPQTLRLLGVPPDADAKSQIMATRDPKDGKS